MKEQFVTYEIAYLLKQKGFDETCFSAYRNTDNEEDLLPLSKWKNSGPENSHEGFCAAPLWQQVIDWLADNYKIEFNLLRAYDDNDKLYRWFNILILEGGPLEMDVLFFEEPIYHKTRNEIQTEAILKAIELI